jgi:Ser/Thr protein kinase RdoA (MazF antagonist)
MSVVLRPASQRLVGNVPVGHTGLHMTHFPITKSYLATAALAGRLEDEYGLADVRCRLISATLRDVHLVTTSRGRFIFYVYRHGYRTREQIAAEWHFVAHLASCGVPVAPAVPTGNGSTGNGHLLIGFDAPEGTRYGVLTTFVDGQHLRQRPSVPAVRTYGRHIATIYTVADAMSAPLNRPVIDTAAILDEAVTASERALIERPDVGIYLHECATRLRPGLDPLPKEPPAYGVVHGDVIRANALVGEDGTVTVLDFDFCGIGWRAYDVASYLLTIRNTPTEAEFAEAFLAGYTDIRALTPEEREAMPLFEAVRAIFAIGTPAKYVDHWGSEYLYAFLDQSLEKLERVMQQLIHRSAAHQGSAPDR